MTLDQAKAELAEVKAALGLQEGKAGMASFATQGTSITRTAYEALQKRRAELERMIHRIENNGAVRHVLFASRT